MLEKQAAEGFSSTASAAFVRVHRGVEAEKLKKANSDFRACSSFTPTNYHFNRPPEPPNSSKMKLFFHLVHKAGELGRKRMWRRRRRRGGVLKGKIEIPYWRGDKPETFNGCAVAEF